jgi:hypothetical protein
LPDRDNPVARVAAMCGTDAATFTRERPDMSAFVLDGGVVYHTYSTYARGLDGLWGMTSGSTAVFCGDKGEETPAAVRFDCMTQVNRLGIRHHRLWPLAARRAGVQRPRHFRPGAGELGVLINK